MIPVVGLIPMRQHSAAFIKGRKSPPHEKPRAGSSLRQAHDIFLANAGKPIPFDWRYRKAQVQQLKDFYGFDLRCVRHGTWVLAGEYLTNGVYVNYLEPEGLEWLLNERESDD